MQAPPLPYNHWSAHLVQNNSVIQLSEEVFELVHFTLYIQWGRIAYPVRHQVSETVFSTVSHDMTKVTLTLVSKYKDGSGPELSSCDKHLTSIMQVTPKRCINPV